MDFYPSNDADSLKFKNVHNSKLAKVQFKS